MADKKINELIKINESGIEIADYAEIVNALFNRYKEIYGNDIELDPRSGDGRFVYDVATIINTSLNVILKLYSNLNPSIAQGAFLDILCSLTNVTRFSATSSVCKVTFTNNTSSDITLTSDLTLIDDAGNEWEAMSVSESGIKIEANKKVEWIYECTEKGPITTTSLKWEILTPANSNVSVSISTLSIGEDEESDEHLRARRASTATNGVSILEALKGNLLKVRGVKDAYIQNIESTSNKLDFGGSSYDTNAHSVAIICRYDTVNEPLENEIGEVINNYMTPGISTNQPSYTDPNLTQYVKKYVDPLSSIAEGEAKLTTYYWLKAYTYHPTITITLYTYNNFSENTLSLIASSLKNYLNALSMNTIVSKGDILQSIQYADPKCNGLYTYYVEDVSFENISDLKTLLIGKALQYDNVTITRTSEEGSNPLTFTIKAN